ncbi:MAG: hypothetical protein ACLSUW_07800 [Akkermansia sp.]
MKKWPPPLQGTSLSEHVLGNGMKVVIREDHRLPLAYACMAFRPDAVRKMSMTPG